MKTEEAYNNWAETYDKVDNPTRSLDEKVVKHILKDIRCKDIVEAGCGTGKSSVWFAENCKSLKSLDLATEMIRIAKEKIIKSNAEFFIHDITKSWPFDNESCDLVSTNLVLEHIENINFVFAEAFRILRENGPLFICELHPLKQKEGTVARFKDKNTEKEIRLVSYYHSKDDFSRAGENASFRMIEDNDWFDDTN